MVGPPLRLRNADPVRYRRRDEAKRQRLGTIPSRRLGMEDGLVTCGGMESIDGPIEDDRRCLCGVCMSRVVVACNGNMTLNGVTREIRSFCRADVRGEMMRVCLTEWVGTRDG